MRAAIAHHASEGTLLASETSHYDQRDRRTARIAADNTADLFAYDPAGQVIAAAYAQAQGSARVPPVNATPAPQAPNTPAPDSFAPQQTFAYDPAGNRGETGQCAKK